MTKKQRLARLADRKDYLQKLLIRETDVATRIEAVNGQIRELEVVADATE